MNNNYYPLRKFVVGGPQSDADTNHGRRAREWCIHKSWSEGMRVVHAQVMVGGPESGACTSHGRRAC